ncbi:EpsD family peptidyl-prolyl cis-trans isomerase [Crenobacter intestini]|uniref:peptidylprolyl isomerase n=1 Tax=Crenobacter intestini TaxID=2563443 RepID=A0A4T0V2E9_9NEIS|nr:EpsD family peptidyl-prolyl cis-trans isomerase [Crenobacter intestini]TIC85336.1 peptidyl-prolyl cis-trans isomerase, EpsD family [Crenobacter intestini]
MMKFRLKEGVLVLSVALALAACGEKKAPASQVAARVGETELTVHQLNAAMPTLSAGLAGEGEEVQKSVLKRMVERELLVQRALSDKLDQDPKIMLALDSARQDILAKAWLDTQVAQLARPTPEQVARYYADNPALFSQRKLYQLQKLTLENRKGVAEEVDRLLAGGGSLQSLAQWASERKLPFNAEAGTVAAEQVPLGVLEKLAALAPGQSLTLAEGDRVVVLRVAGVEQAPRTEAQAAGEIEQFLLSRERQQQVSRLLAQLKKDSPVEYTLFPDLGGAQASAPAATR